jgi:hypothetical protein
MNNRAYALGVVMVALTMAATIALRTFAEAAFLDHYGARWLPYLYVAHAVSLAAVTIGYDRLTQRAAVSAADTGLLLGLGAVAAAAPAMVGLGGGAPAAMVLAVVALSSIATLAVWNSVAAAVAGRDARRALPRAGAAVTGGGALAGLGAVLLVPRFGATPLAYAAAVLIAIVAVVAVAQRRALAAGGAPGATAPPGSAPTMSGDHRALVRWLFVAAVVEAAVATILEVRFNAAAQARWQGRDLAVGIGLFYGLSNAFLFVLQLGIVPRLLVTRRLPVTLSTHPLALAAATIGVVVMPGFTTLAAARVTDHVLRAATSRTGQEVSLSALPPVPRARWKVLLRGAATPLGTAAMGAALILATELDVTDLATLAAIAIGLMAIWLVVVRRAARRFLAALATPLGLRGLAISGVERTTFDLAQLEASVAAAGDEDPRRAAIGRALIARTSVTSDELVRHLDHDNPSVRAALFSLIARAPSPAARREVAAAVTIEDDDVALCGGLRALAELGEAGGLARGRDRAGMSDPVARAVEAAEVHLGLVTGDEAARRVRALTHRDGAWAGAIARTRPELGDAIAAEITAEARGVEHWRAAAGAGHAGAAGRLLAALAAGAPGTVEAISELDEREVEALDAAISGTDAAVDARVALARARAAGATPASLLWRLAADPEPEVRAAALRSLVGRVRAGAVVTASRIAPIVDRELGVLDALLTARATATPPPAVELRHAVRRVLDAAAIEAAATGRDPAPLVALGRHLVVANEPARKRALDVVQEVAATRPRLLDAIERYLAPPPGGLASVDDSDPKRAALRRAAVFADAPPRTLAGLAAAARELELPADHVVFARGDAGDTMYVVIAGELVVTGRPAPLGPGAVFGELALVDDGPRTATVTTRTAARLLAIDRAAFQTAVARSPELGLALAARFAAWLV